MHRAAFRRVGAKGRGVTSLKAPFRVQPCAGADSLPRRIHIRSDRPPSSTTTSSRPAPVHRHDSMLKSAADAPFVQLWIRRPAKPSATGSRAKSSVGAALTLRPSMTAKAGTGAGLVTRDRMSALPLEHESRCGRRHNGAWTRSKRRSWWRQCRNASLASDHPEATCVHWPPKRRQASSLAGRTLRTGQPRKRSRAGLGNDSPTFRAGSPAGDCNGVRNCIPGSSR